MTISVMKMVVAIVKTAVVVMLTTAAIAQIVGTMKNQEKFMKMNLNKTSRHVSLPNQLSEDIADTNYCCPICGGYQVDGDVCDTCESELLA